MYIPKANGKKRHLVILAVVDRVIQQAISQVLSPINENYFSEYSYGFRQNRDYHKAMNKALEYINEGYTYIIDLDMENGFVSPSIEGVPQGGPLHHYY